MCRTVYGIKVSINLFTTRVHVRIKTYGLLKKLFYHLMVKCSLSMDFWSTKIFFVNMEAKSIISELLIMWDQLVELQKSKSIKSFRDKLVKRYEHYLDSEKKKKSAETRKRKQAEKEIKQLQTKRSHIETSFKQMLDSADRFALQAEKQHKMELLVKSNAFRKLFKISRLKWLNWTKIFNKKN